MDAWHSRILSTSKAGIRWRDYWSMQKVVLCSFACRQSSWSWSSLRMFQNQRFCFAFNFFARSRNWSASSDIFIVLAPKELRASPRSCAAFVASAKAALAPLAEELAAVCAADAPEAAGGAPLEGGPKREAPPPEVGGGGGGGRGGAWRGANTGPGVADGRNKSWWEGPKPRRWSMVLVSKSPPRACAKHSRRVLLDLSRANRPRNRPNFLPPEEPPLVSCCCAPEAEVDGPSPAAVAAASSCSKLRKCWARCASARVEEEPSAEALAARVEAAQRPREAMVDPEESR
mmetsp:Transcript_43104/g.92954  ORF Transcript_43104/g.92954 Transcript_43104/m.92954 type:complete len:288 (+) Transcript_43104:143-1006(+)